MISPVSSGAAAYVQNAQAAAKVQTTASSAPQSSAASSTHDTVELSSQAKAALSGNGSTQSKNSSYAPPSTTSAHTGRTAAAS